MTDHPTSPPAVHEGDRIQAALKQARITLNSASVQFGFYATEHTWAKAATLQSNKETTND